MTRINDKVKRFLFDLQFDPNTNATIRNHILAEMVKTGPQETAVDVHIATAKDVTQPMPARQASLTVLIKLLHGD